MAVNCRSRPFAIDAGLGVTVIVWRTAVVTLRTTVLLVLPLSVAVTLVMPILVPVASPPLGPSGLNEATAPADESHATCVVMF